MTIFYALHSIFALEVQVTFFLVNVQMMETIF